MIGFLLGSAMFLGLTGGVISFVGWAFREHAMANAFRRHSCEAFVNSRKAKEATETPSGPRWKITYKNAKGKTEVATVPGDTEAVALRDFCKAQTVGYDRIISSVKV